MPADGQDEEAPPAGVAAGVVGVVAEAAREPPHGAGDGGKGAAGELSFPNCTTYCRYTYST